MWGKALLYSHCIPDNWKKLYKMRLQMLKQSLFQLGWNFLVKQNAMLKFLHVWAGCWWWRWAGHCSRTPDQQQQGVNQYMSAVDNRSWHATMLPRQHNHVLRPQNFWLCLICWLCLYLLIMSIFVVATPFRHRDIFSIFSCHWSCITLSRCRCRCRWATQLSRAQLCR